MTALNTCVGDEMDEFIDDEEPPASKRPRTQKHLCKSRSARAKLDWSDSSSDKAKCKSQRQQQQTVTRSNAKDGLIQDEEDEPHVAGVHLVICILFIAVFDYDVQCTVNTETKCQHAGMHAL